jgi:heme/copper-type cytochrome/quinol oxidase subunit 3
MTPADVEPPVLDDPTIVEELLADIGRLPPPLSPGDDDGDDRPGGEGERTPFVPNAVLGLLVFLAAETMLFAALIAGFLVLRASAAVWPPPLQPRLPVEVTGVNTAVLLFSSVTMWRALRAIRQGSQAGLVRGLGQTLLLGALFLGVQGYEWVRLVSFGLTVSSGSYGGTFYTLIGTHGVHVFGALIWLGIVLLRARRGRFGARAHEPVLLCGVYWSFVVFLWPLLYLLVYLP